jgi:hypothetical protein
MIKIILSLIFLVSLTFISCSSSSIKGSGTAVNEERKIDYVSKVVVKGNFKVDITCGETTNLKVEAEDNILPLIETKVEDEKLTIKSLQNLTNLREIRIVLTTHTLTELDCEGKNTITIKGLNSDDFDLNIDGENEVAVEGKVDNFSTTIDGESKLLAKDLLTKFTQINLYGEGKAEINARKSLKAKVKGAGSVDYYGDPEEISINAIKGGSVNKK